MIKVFASDSPLEAHFARGLLEARGIPATVTGEDMAMAPSVVWVGESDADRAMWAIAAADDATRPAGTLPAESWPCPDCGENLETQFLECWQCGYVVPAHE